MFPEQDLPSIFYRLFLPVCTSTFFTFWIAVNIFAVHLFIFFCIVEKLFLPFGWRSIFLPLDSGQYFLPCILFLFVEKLFCPLDSGQYFCLHFIQ
jgi:hypothetical protein